MNILERTTMRLSQKSLKVPASILSMAVKDIPPPSVIISGATRSGSTTIYSALSEHPDVSMSPRKELWFFNNDEKFQSGLNSYKSFFTDFEGEKVVGESTPFYLHKGILFRNSNRETIYYSENDSAARRIHEWNPECKIIICLRSPFERIESQFEKNLTQGKKLPHDINEKIKDDIEKIDSEKTNNFVYYNKYKTHCDHFIDVFGRDRVLFLNFKKLTENPKSIFETICNFLEIDNPSLLRIPKNLNSRSLYEHTRPDRFQGHLSTKILNALSLTLKDDVEFCQDLLGEDLGDWMRI